MRHSVWSGRGRRPCTHAIPSSNPLQTCNDDWRLNQNDEWLERKKHHTQNVLHADHFMVVLIETDEWETVHSLCQALANGNRHYSARQTIRNFRWRGEMRCDQQMWHKFWLISGFDFHFNHQLPMSIVNISRWFMQTTMLVTFGYNFIRNTCCMAHGQEITHIR